MATHGIIARVTGDGFIGSYHHHDSYPSGLGRAAWRAIRCRFGRDAEAFLAWAIDEHPQGWKSLPDEALRKDGISEGLTDRMVDWLSVEWGYAIDPASASMAILKSDIDPGTGRYRPRVMATVPLDGAEPDWRALDREGGIE
jgi:hypothetical protein